MSIKLKQLEQGTSGYFLQTLGSGGARWTTVPSVRKVITQTAHGLAANRAVYVNASGSWTYSDRKSVV